MRSHVFLTSKRVVSARGISYLPDADLGLRFSQHYIRVVVARLESSFVTEFVEAGGVRFSFLTSKGGYVFGMAASGGAVEGKSREAGKVRSRDFEVFGVRNDRC